MDTEKKDRKRAINPVLAELQKRIRLDLNDIADNMSTGGCRDYPEYQNQVGRVTGLAAAERHLLDLDIQMDVDE